MGVDPEDAAGPAPRREAAERAERDRVVAAEHERQAALLDRAGDERGDLLAGGDDLGQEAHARRPPTVDASATAVWTLPQSETERPSAGQPRLEPRVADRRRPHVDTAPAGAEVERRADDGDGRAHVHPRSRPSSSYRRRFGSAKYSYSRARVSGLISS